MKPLGLPLQITAREKVKVVGPNGLEPLTSTVSILKMRVAAMSSSSVSGSFHAGFMTVTK
jgi:hypothetical protein